MCVCVCVCPCVSVCPQPNVISSVYMEVAGEHKGSLCDPGRPESCREQFLQVNNQGGSCFCGATDPSRCVPARDTLRNRHAFLRWLCRPRRDPSLVLTCCLWWLSLQIDIAPSVLWLLCVLFLPWLVSAYFLVHVRHIIYTLHNII